MTPERLKELIALREVRDDLQKIYENARDEWLKSCSDLNYAMLEELDYYHYIKGISKEKPDWYHEVKGTKPPKEVITRQKADALVEQMLKQAAEPKKKEKKDDSSWKPLW